MITNCQRARPLQFMTEVISVVIADKEVSNVKEVTIDTEVVSDTKVANEGQIGAFACLIQGRVEKDLQPSVHHTKYEDPAPSGIKT